MEELSAGQASTLVRNEQEIDRALAEMEELEETLVDSIRCARTHVMCAAVWVGWVGAGGRGAALAEVEELEETLVDSIRCALGHDLVVLSMNEVAALDAGCAVLPGVGMS